MIKKKVIKNNQVIKEFIGKKDLSLLKVKRLMQKINKMFIPAKNRQEAKEAYGLMPDKQILRNKIPVFYLGEKPMFGCYQANSILYSCLHEIGLKPKLIRYFPINNGISHTEVYFKYNNTWYNADVFNNLRLKKVSESSIKDIQKNIKNKKALLIRPGDYTYEMFLKEKKTKKLIKPNNY
jgi:hypothetical protein